MTHLPPPAHQQLLPNVAERPVPGFPAIRRKQQGVVWVSLSMPRQRPGQRNHYLLGRM